jgi:hypothetical protein
MPLGHRPLRTSPSAGSQVPTIIDRHRADESVAQLAADEDLLEGGAASGLQRL